MLNKKRNFLLRRLILGGNHDYEQKPKTLQLPGANPTNYYTIQSGKSALSKNLNEIFNTLSDPTNSSVSKITVSLKPPADLSTGGPNQTIYLGFTNQDFGSTELETSNNNTPLLLQNGFNVSVDSSGNMNVYYNGSLLGPLNPTNPYNPGDLISLTYEITASGDVFIGADTFTQGNETLANKTPFMFVGNLDITTNNTLRMLVQNINTLGQTSTTNSTTISVLDKSISNQITSIAKKVIQSTDLVTLNVSSTLSNSFIIGFSNTNTTPEGIFIAEGNCKKSQSLQSNIPSVFDITFSNTSFPSQSLFLCILVGSSGLMPGLSLTSESYQNFKNFIQSNSLLYVDAITNKIFLNNINTNTTFNLLSSNVYKLESSILTTNLLKLQNITQAQSFSYTFGTNQNYYLVIGSYNRSDLTTNVITSCDIMYTTYSQSSFKVNVLSNKFSTLTTETITVDTGSSTITDNYVFNIINTDLYTKSFPIKLNFSNATSSNLDKMYLGILSKSYSVDYPLAINNIPITSLSGFLNKLEYYQDMKGRIFNGSNVNSSIATTNLGLDLPSNLVLSQSSFQIRHTNFTVPTTIDYQYDFTSPTNGYWIVVFASEKQDNSIQINLQSSGFGTNGSPSITMQANQNLIKQSPTDILDTLQAPNNTIIQTLNLINSSTTSPLATGYSNVNLNPDTQSLSGGLNLSNGVYLVQDPVTNKAIVYLNGLPILDITGNVTNPMNVQATFLIQNNGDISITIPGSSPVINSVYLGNLNPSPDGIYLTTQQYSPSGTDTTVSTVSIASTSTNNLSVTNQVLMKNFLAVSPIVSSQYECALYENTANEFNVVSTSYLDHDFTFTPNTIGRNFIFGVRYLAPGDTSTVPTGMSFSLFKSASNIQKYEIFLFYDYTTSQWKLYTGGNGTSPALMLYTNTYFDIGFVLRYNAQSVLKRFEIYNKANAPDTYTSLKTSGKFRIVLGMQNTVSGSLSTAINLNFTQQVNIFFSDLAVQYFNPVTLILNAQANTTQNNIVKIKPSSTSNFDGIGGFKLTFLTPNPSNNIRKAYSFIAGTSFPIFNNAISNYETYLQNQYLTVMDGKIYKYGVIDYNNATYANAMNTKMYFEFNATSGTFAIYNDSVLFTSYNLSGGVFPVNMFLCISNLTTEGSITLTTIQYLDLYSYITTTTLPQTALQYGSLVSPSPIFVTRNLYIEKSFTLSINSFDYTATSTPQIFPTSTNDFCYGLADFTNIAGNLTNVDEITFRNWAKAQVFFSDYNGQTYQNNSFIASYGRIGSTNLSLSLDYSNNLTISGISSFSLNTIINTITTPFNYDLCFFMNFRKQRRTLNVSITSSAQTSNDVVTVQDLVVPSIGFSSNTSQTLYRTTISYSSLLPYIFKLTPLTTDGNCYLYIPSNAYINGPTTSYLSNLKSQIDDKTSVMLLNKDGEVYRESTTIQSNFNKQMFKNNEDIYLRLNMNGMIDYSIDNLTYTNDIGAGAFSLGNSQYFNLYSITQPSSFKSDLIQYLGLTGITISRNNLSILISQQNSVALSNTNFYVLPSDYYMNYQPPFRFTLSFSTFVGSGRINLGVASSFSNTTFSVSGWDTESKSKKLYLVGCKEIYQLGVRSSSTTSFVLADPRNSTVVIVVDFPTSSPTSVSLIYNNQGVNQYSMTINNVTPDLLFFYPECSSGFLTNNFFEYSSPYIIDGGTSCNFNTSYTLYKNVGTGNFLCRTLNFPFIQLLRDVTAQFIFTVDMSGFPTGTYFNHWKRRCFMGFNLILSNTTSPYSINMSNNTISGYMSNHVNASSVFNKLITLLESGENYAYTISSDIAAMSKTTLRNYIDDTTKKYIKFSFGSQGGNTSHQNKVAIYDPSTTTYYSGGTAFTGSDSGGGYRYSSFFYSVFDENLTTSASTNSIQFTLTSPTYDSIGTGLKIYESVSSTTYTYPTQILLSTLPSIRCQCTFNIYLQPYYNSTAATLELVLMTNVTISDTTAVKITLTLNGITENWTLVNSKTTPVTIATLPKADFPYTDLGILKCTLAATTGGSYFIINNKTYDLGQTITLSGSTNFWGRYTVSGTRSVINMSTGHYPLPDPSTSWSFQPSGGTMGGAPVQVMGSELDQYEGFTVSIEYTPTGITTGDLYFGINQVDGSGNFVYPDTSEVCIYHDAFALNRTEINNSKDQMASSATTNTLNNSIVNTIKRKFVLVMLKTFNISYRWGYYQNDVLIYYGSSNQIYGNPKIILVNSANVTLNITKNLSTSFPTELFGFGVNTTTQFNDSNPITFNYTDSFYTYLWYRSLVNYSYTYTFTRPAISGSTTYYARMRMDYKMSNTIPGNYSTSYFGITWNVTNNTFFLERTLDNFTYTSVYSYSFTAHERTTGQAYVMNWSFLGYASGTYNLMFTFTLVINGTTRLTVNTNMASFFGIASTNFTGPKNAYYEFFVRSLAGGTLTTPPTLAISNIVQ